MYIGIKQLSKWMVMVGVIDKQDTDKGGDR